MDYVFAVLFVMYSVLSVSMCKKCNFDKCPEEGRVTCAFSEKDGNYSMFATKCTFKVYNTCHKLKLKKVPLKYCIKQYKASSSSRRVYGDSCPLFCPSHYMPVCGRSKLRAYMYKTFNNGCNLDMLNCRGDEDNGYVEVPLHFCQKHLMKNIFKEKLVLTGMNDYRDYHEY